MQCNKPYTPIRRNPRRNCRIYHRIEVLVDSTDATLPPPLSREARPYVPARDPGEQAHTPQQTAETSGSLDSIGPLNFVEALAPSPGHRTIVEQVGLQTVRVGDGGNVAQSGPTERGSDQQTKSTKLGRENASRILRTICQIIYATQLDLRTPFL
ncbi:hypothetical protein Cgig2_013787 [Carnegiea gigantea]|uniref:Uncharacterized protein n=1 Tax=Carnegiea gigantea TaxID=171969 RepID=A0A9Q1JRQ1_9CARY|nr:hypothetical protein Cgig2_013787 [Carnegiea gigantea]